MSIVLQSSAGGQITIQEPATASNFTQTLPAGTGTTVVNGVNSALVSGSAVASTSGTSIDFTSIPSWVKRITVLFNGVSTSGTSAPQIQLGGAGGFEITGYSATASTGATVVASTTGFPLLGVAAAADTYSGCITLSSFGSNTWVSCGNLAQIGTHRTQMSAGSKSLSDVLTQVRITTVNGTDTFDAGSINILYE